ncbi:hypothetical protein [Frankia sp. AgB32]
MLAFSPDGTSLASGSDDQTCWCGTCSCRESRPGCLRTAIRF